MMTIRGSSPIPPGSMDASSELRENLIRCAREICERFRGELGNGVGVPDWADYRPAFDSILEQYIILPNQLPKQPRRS
jgi:hypothetical protein